MGYIFLLLGNLTGVSKGYCGKRVSEHFCSLQSTLIANIIRTTLCAVISIILIALSGNISSFSFSANVILISLLAGVGTAAFLIFWLIAVKSGVYMMLDVFIMLGVVIPVIAGRLVLFEQIKLNQVLGFALLLIAAIIMCSYNNSIKNALTLRSLIVLILVGVGNGVSSFAQKLFVYKAPDIPISVFNLYTYTFAAIILLLALLFFKKPTSADREPFKNKKVCIYIFLMAVLFFGNTYFMTKAAIYLDSAVMYPLTQGVALILSTLMATFFFKEKLKMKAVIGILIAFAASIINIL